MKNIYLIAIPVGVSITTTDNTTAATITMIVRNFIRCSTNSFNPEMTNYRARRENATIRAANTSRVTVNTMIASIFMKYSFPLLPDRPKNQATSAETGAIATKHSKQTRCRINIAPPTIRSSRVFSSKKNHIFNNGRIRTHPTCDISRMNLIYSKFLPTKSPAQRRGFYNFNGKYLCWCSVAMLTFLRRDT